MSLLSSIALSLVVITVLISSEVKKGPVKAKLQNMVAMT